MIMYNRIVGGIGVALLVVFLVVLSLQIMGELDSSSNEDACTPVYFNDC